MTIYAYSRCSHRDSEESGAGLAAQDRENSRLAEDVQCHSPEQRWGIVKAFHDNPGHFCDKTTSAFRIPLFERKAGKQLLDTLKKGDYVVCSKVDRMFRSIYDMAATMKKFEVMGVFVRFGNIPVDTGTPMGKVVLAMLASMAEWESHMKSIRTKEALAMKKARGSVVPSADKQASQRPREAAARSPSLTKSAQFDVKVLEHMGVESTGRDQPVPKKPGKVWIYLRCSHLDSVESGLGLEWQEKVCRRKAEEIMADNPLVNDIEVVRDEAVSAWRYLFRNRPSGRRVFEEAKSGDHIVIARLDRGFRNTRDIAETIPHLIDRGVNVVFASEGMDFSTVWGRVALMVLGQFAELEPAITSARTRDALRELRAVGRGISGAFAGFKMVGKGDDRQMVMCRRSVALKRLAYWLQEVCGMSAKRASERCEELIAKREGRKPIPLSGLNVGYACRYFGLPMEVIKTMQQSTAASAKRCATNNRGLSCRGMICRSVGVGMAYHSRVQWPRIREYVKAKRREARERLARRDAAELCSSEN